MRIGIDGRFWHSSNAGLSQHTKGIVKALAKYDKENKYIVFLRKNGLEEWDLNVSNFQVEVVDIKHFSLSEQFIFPLKLLIHKLDLMYFPNFNHPIFYPGKFITTVHDLAYLQFPGNLLKGPVFKWGYFLVLWMGGKCAYKILADTQIGKDEFVKRLGAHPKKIEVIPLGVDFSRFKQDRKQMLRLKQKLGIHCPVIFYVGGWRPHKNIPVLLSAFQKIRTKTEARLLLGGMPSSEILELIEQHPFKKDIIVSRFIPEVELANYFGLADVFVFPSLYEGFGLPILEAQYMDVPVAVSQASTLPEVGGEGALYFNPQDDQDMAAVILKILKDKKVQQKLIDRGRENLKRFSWDKSAQKLHNIFRNSL